MIGWLLACLAGWLVGWLAGWQACCLGSWLAGLAGLAQPTGRQAAGPLISDNVHKISALPTYVFALA